MTADGQGHESGADRDDAAGDGPAVRAELRHERATAAGVMSAGGRRWWQGGAKWHGYTGRDGEGKRYGDGSVAGQIEWRGWYW